MLTPLFEDELDGNQWTANVLDGHGMQFCLRQFTSLLCVRDRGHLGCCCSAKTVISTLSTSSTPFTPYDYDGLF